MAPFLGKFGGRSGLTPSATPKTVYGDALSHDIQSLSFKDAGPPQYIPRVPTKVYEHSSSAADLFVHSMLAKVETRCGAACA